MSRTATLAVMIAAVRWRADMPDTTFVTDADIEYEINQSALDLYDKLLSAWGEGWRFTQSNLLTTANVAYVALPADFYRLIKVGWRVTASENPRQLQPFQSRDEWLPDDPQTWDEVELPGYAIRNHSLYLSPTPTAIYTLVLQYVPALAAITASPSAPLEGVHGWEDYVIYDCAIKLKIKEEVDATALAVERARHEARILQMAPSRDVEAPSRIQRVRHQWDSARRRRGCCV